MRNHNDTTTSLLSPSRPNTSRRWIFQRFQRRIHLPPIQPRAGGRPFWRFNMSGTTTTTSLASKCEPEVDFSAVSKLLPSLPPRVQTRARGEFFWRFDATTSLGGYSTTTGRCETHTPPRSNVFPALRGSWVSA